MTCRRIGLGAVYGFIVCLLAVASAHSRPALGDDPSARIADSNNGVSAPLDLAAFLKSKGYVEIPLTRTNGGHFDVDVRIKGKTLTFILDTGAQSIVIDSDVAAELKLPVQKTNQMHAGIGGAVALQIAPDQHISVGSFEGRFTVVVGELKFVNEERQKMGDKPCAGLLGFPLLKLNGAVIDYTSEKLFLMGPAASIPAVFESSKASVRLEVGVNRMLNNSKMTFGLSIKVLDDKPELITFANYGQIQSGTTYAQVGAALGGNLDKCNLAAGFSGTIRFQQGKNHINLTLQNGKVTAKSFEAAE
jgi:predicted aspartyl protease